MTNEEFVRALYLGLLGRDADAAGLADHVAWFDQVGISQAPQLIRAFSESEEFRSERDVAEILPQLLPRPSGEPFAHVAGLGTSCYASKTLKNMGLKRYSLPFDWIFTSLAMVAHCLEDDFATFLDPSHYRPVPEGERPSVDTGLCDHAFYRAQFQVSYVFNHYDPTGLGQYHYLRRAVIRFRQLMASSGRKLFFCTVIGPETEDGARDWARLARLLEQRTTNATLFALMILPASGTTAFGHVERERWGNHSLGVYQPMSQMEGIRFRDPFDEIMVRRLLAQFRYEPAAAP